MDLRRTVLIMKKQIWTFLFLLAFAFSISAQEKEAVKIDELGLVACGQFSAQMDRIFVKLQKSPNSKLYIIYYGGRYRKEYSKWNSQTRSYDEKKLKYPHREDGLNWAKSIPLFLTTERNYAIEFHNRMKNNIVLINGGFREDTKAEIWLVPKNTKSPLPTPTIREENVKFRADEPVSIRDFTTCYSG